MDPPQVILVQNLASSTCQYLRIWLGRLDNIKSTQQKLVHGTMCMHIRVCVLACRRHIRNGILVGELVHGTMCMHIRVCVCLCAADIFATVLWLENWSTGPRACMSPACKHLHTDMHARGPTDDFSNKNHFASMQASTHGYAMAIAPGPRR